MNALLLAAGGSRRMGRPKQLIEVEGVTLIRRSTVALLQSTCESVDVVLGNRAEELKLELEKLEVGISNNENWKAGMGESIRLGLESMLENHSPDAAILCVCDQPYLTPKVIDGLLDLYNESGKGIALCDYGNGFGPPAVFSKHYFHNLLKLSGDEGARSIIRKYSGDVAYYKWTDGKIDWDTPEDLVQ